MAAATVAVVGATGVLGRHVVQRLIERGHDVRPIVRKDENVRWFERLGVRAERGDILDGKSLERALRGCHSASIVARSIIHVADMADAVVRAHERGPSKTILSIVDDEPARYASLYRHIAAVEGAPEPQTGGATAFPSFRVSNARAHRLLDWSPRFFSYRSGLV